MFGRLRSIRHPFYPDLRPTHARAATGRHTVLAGHFEELEQAAARGARATHAIFVLQEEGACPATGRQRDRLWEWFCVPSFVLVLDGAGKVLAYECEAEEGLHVAADAGLAAPDTSLCPCGRAGPRIGVAVRPQRQSARSLPLAHSLSGGSPAV